MAGFYPPATPGAVNRSVHIMSFALGFLASKNRRRVRALLNRIKPALCDSLVPEEPVEAYALMDSELLARFNRAVKHYPELLAQLQAHRAGGEPLGADFAVNFEGIEPAANPEAVKKEE